MNVLNENVVVDPAEIPAARKTISENIIGYILATSFNAAAIFFKSASEINVVALSD